MRLVEGAENVERIFGHWPDFHDAEVLTITLDRGSFDPTIRLSVHAFEMTPEVDERGFCVLRNHVVVTFHFHSVEDVDLTGFNQQNVLAALSFSRPETPVAEGEKLQVDLESSYGLSGSFRCARAEVVSVEPFEDPRGAGPAGRVAK